MHVCVLQNTLDSMAVMEETNCTFYYIYYYIVVCMFVCVRIQGVSGGIVNILGGGCMDCSK